MKASLDAEGGVRGASVGLLTGNRSQVLLAEHTVSSLPDSPTLYTRNLGADQLKTALKILKEFGTAELLPMNQAVDDAVRIELDTRVLVDMLRLLRKLLPHLDLVREWWCCEPHVRGP